VRRPMPTKGERCLADFRKPLRAYTLAADVRSQLGLARQILAGMKGRDDRRRVVETLHRNADFLLGSRSIPEQHLQLPSNPAQRWCDVNAKDFRSRAILGVGLLRKAAQADGAAAEDLVHKAEDQFRKAEREASLCAGTVAEVCGMAKNAKRLREIRRGPPKKREYPLSGERPWRANG